MTIPGRSFTDLALDEYRRTGQKPTPSSIEALYRSWGSGTAQLPTDNQFQAVPNPQKGPVFGAEMPAQQPATLRTTKMPPFSLVGPNNEALPQVKMPDGTVRKATAFVNGEPYWGNLNAPTGFWNDIGRSLDNYWVDQWYKFTAPVEQPMGQGSLKETLTQAAQAPGLGEKALGIVSGISQAASNTIHDWNNVPFGLHYLTRGISSVIGGALQLLQAPAQAIERGVGTIGNVITGHTLDESYQASKILYSAALNPGLTDEFIRRYKAGENPFQLVAELQDPIKEMIGQMIDPFLIVGFLGDAGKIGRWAKSLDTVTDMYTVAGDSAKALYNVKTATDKVVALADGVVIYDKEFQLARDGFTSLRTATSGKVATAVKASVASGVVNNLEGISHDILMAVARTEKSPEDVVSVLRDLAVMASKDSSAADKAISLGRIADKGSATVLLSKGGRQLGVVLADTLMSEGKFSTARITKLKALIEEAKSSGELEGLVKGTTEMLGPTLKRMFPDLSERIRASDKIAQIKAAGGTVPKELERFLVNGAAEEISAPMRYLNFVGNKLDFVKNPINRVLSTVYMGINPAFAVRNGLSNLAVMLIDDPAAIFMSPARADAIFEKFGIPFQALHGYESAGVMGEKGMMAGKTTLLNYASRLSNKFEMASAKAVTAKALERAWGKLMPKVMRGADELGNSPFKTLTDAGIAARDINTAESIVYDGGTSAKAVKALIGNDYYAKITLNATDAEKAALNELHVYEALLAAKRDARNDPARFMKAVEQIIEETRFTARMKTEVVLSEDVVKARGGAEFLADQQLKHSLVDAGEVGKANDLYEYRTAAKLEANAAYEDAVIAAQNEALHRATLADKFNGVPDKEQGPIFKNISAMNEQARRKLKASYDVFSKANKANRDNVISELKRLSGQEFGSPEREAVYNAFKEKQHQLWVELAERDFPIYDQHLAALAVQDDQLIQVAQQAANRARLWNEADEDWARAGVYVTKRKTPLEVSAMDWQAREALERLAIGQSDNPSMPNFMDEAAVDADRRLVNDFVRRNGKPAELAKMFGPTRTQQTIVQGEIISGKWNSPDLVEKYPELLNSLQNTARGWAKDATDEVVTPSWWQSMVRTYGKEPSKQQVAKSLLAISKGTDSGGNLPGILKQLILDEIYTPASQMDVSKWIGLPDFLAHQLMLADWTHDPNMTWRIIDQAQKIAAGSLELPPLETGFVRLFRGESIPGSGPGLADWVQQGRVERGMEQASGRWFTHSYKEAQWYLADSGQTGHIVYVDVPENVAKAAHLPNQPPEIQRFSKRPDVEYFLPEEYKGKGKEVVSTANPAFYEKFLETAMTPAYLGEAKTTAAINWFASPAGMDAGALEHGYTEMAKNIWTRMLEGEAPTTLAPSTPVEELQRAPKTAFGPTTATEKAGGIPLKSPGGILPKLKEGFTRVIHLGSPENEESIKVNGLNYEKQGSISGTSRLFSNEADVVYGVTDPRFSNSTAYVFDIPNSDVRLHNDPTKSPGSIDPKYYVGKLTPDEVQIVDRAKKGNITLWQIGEPEPADYRTTLKAAGYPDEYIDNMSEVNRVQTYNNVKKGEVARAKGGIPLSAPASEVLGGMPSPSAMVGNNEPGLAAKIRAIAAKQTWEPPAESNLTAAQTQALMKWGAEIDARMAPARAGAYAAADAARKFTLLDYADKHGYDLALSYIFPYQFWYNRTYRNFITRIVDKPWVAASYARYKDALAKVHAGMPDWWKYNINSDELLGIHTDNPLFFNLEATLNPLNGILGVDFTDPNRNTGWFANAITEIGKMGPSVWTPITMAVGLAAYIQGNEAGGSAWIGRTIPITSGIKAATALAGIRGTGSVLTPAGLELDPAMVLQGGMGTYDRRRVGRMLAQMVQQGTITEAQAIDAGSAQSGDVWNTAVQYAQVDPTAPWYTTRAVNTLASNIIGVGAKGRTQGDLMIDQFYGEMSALSAMRTQMAPAEYQKAWGVIRQRYPFMDTLLLSRKSDDTRDGALSYNILSRIPPGQQTEYSKMVALDSRLIDLFYKTKGDFAQWDTQDKAVFLAGIKNLGAVLDCPPTTLRRDWDRAKANYAAMMTQADQIWGTGIQNAVTQYYSEKADPVNGSENANIFLQANPEVGEFLDWKAQVVLNDPTLNKYYGGIQFLEGWYRSQMYKTAAAKFGNDVFNTNSLYFKIKEQGGDYAAYLRDTPVVKEYWKFLAEYRPQIAKALEEVGSLFPETPQGIVRADAKLTSLGSQDVFNGMKQLQSGLSAKNEAIVAAYSSGGKGGVTPSFSIGDYIQTEGGKRWPDAQRKLDQFKALSASNKRAAAAYYQANLDLQQYMKFDDEVRAQYNASQNQKFAYNQAYTTQEWRKMLGDNLYRLIRADRVPDSVLPQLDQMAQQGGMGSADTLIQLVQASKDWAAPATYAEWANVLPYGLIKELRKRRPSQKAQEAINQIAAQYGVAVGQIMSVIAP